MAVKPITNKQVVASSNINRAKQVSTKNTNADGNRKKSLAPGINYSDNYAITLKDVDLSIMSHVKNVIKPKVKEANETVDVTVMYGNEERWVSARKRGVLRDKNGSLLLPLIMLKRTGIEKSTSVASSFEHDVKREHAEVIRHSTWSKKNRYDRFAVQTGKKPITESLVTTMPNFVNITYEFVVWTGFIEQMNPLVETFADHNNTYWGNSEQYKFLCKLDSIADASEMSQDGERFIKSTFSVTTNAYLLPEYTNSVVTGKISNMRKILSTSKVVFGFEGDASDSQIKLGDK
tara:strand:+ start:3116 stop:3988 length:873 start_codon:yes stop_codon:yes gene_type:complete